jgi:capsule polysaccharide export protein KpsE/RkpR
MSEKPGIRVTSRVATVVVACVVLAACSSSSTTTTSPAAASTSAEVCASLQALQTSVDALVHISPLQVSVQGIQDAVAKVQTDLDAVASSAGSDLGPQVDALKRSIQEVATTLSSGQSVSAVAGQLATQLPAVGTAWANFTSAASSLNCDLSSA